MKEYISKNNQSRTLERKPKIGRQTPDIRKYLNNQLHVVQRIPDWDGSEQKYLKFEKAVGVRNVPMLIIENNKILKSFNCTSPPFKLHLLMLACKIDEENIDNILDFKGGALYSLEARCVYLLNNYAYKRYVIHELGHAKQHYQIGATSINTDSSFLEAHNIIVNENKYPYIEPEHKCKNQYLRVDNPYNDGVLTSHKIDMGIYDSKYIYYRVIYSQDNLNKFISTYKNMVFDYDRLRVIFSNDKLNKMYVEMKMQIHSINSNLVGEKYNFIKCRWDEKESVVSALTALMNWGIEKQLLNLEK